MGLDHNDTGIGLTLALQDHNHKQCNILNVLNNICGHFPESKQDPLYDQVS